MKTVAKIVLGLFGAIVVWVAVELVYLVTHCTDLGCR